MLKNPTNEVTWCGMPSRIPWPCNLIVEYIIKCFRKTWRKKWTRSIFVAIFAIIDDNLTFFPSLKTKIFRPFLIFFFQKFSSSKIFFRMKKIFFQKFEFFRKNGLAVLVIFFVFVMLKFHLDQKNLCRNWKSSSTRMSRLPTCEKKFCK